MAEAKAGLMTAGAMAKELGISDGKVKKAIQELGLKPAEKKGVCSYFTLADLKKIKASLK